MPDRDMLLYGQTDTDDLDALWAWVQSTPGLHTFVPDYHRLQIEKWIWDRREAMGPRIMDVGVDAPRRWLGAGYFTFGEGNEDVGGDITEIAFPEASIDTVICTEVLEHCADPWRAVRELRRVLKPGGRLFATSPFFWPWHGTVDYRDYWRFTAQGWELLLRDFSSLKIAQIQWTTEGAAAYDLMRRFECMGMRALTVAATGYLCEAVK